MSLNLFVDDLLLFKLQILSDNFFITSVDISLWFSKMFNNSFLIIWNEPFDTN